MEEFFQLRKTRDFGACISDSILFLKLHWKNLLTLYFIFVVPLLLVAVLTGSGSFAAFFTSLGKGVEGLSNPFKLFTPIFFVTMLIYLLTATIYATVVFLYMRGYDEKGRSPTLQEVARMIPRKTFSNAGYILLMFLTIIAGMLVAIVPILGILVFFAGSVYLAVNYALVMPVNTIEDHPYAFAFSRSFYLVRNRWWYAFGYCIILFLIYYFFAMVIGLIVNIAFGISAVNFLDVDGASKLSRKFFIITGLSGIIQQVFYLIIHVGLGIFYYSLREEKDGSGLEARLDQLGRGTTPDSSVEDQY
jgi:hypothetical protein